MKITGRGSDRTGPEPFSLFAICGHPSYNETGRKLDTRGADSDEDTQRHLFAAQ